MNFTERMARVLASPNPGVIVERIRGEFDAQAAAVLACVADGIRVMTAAPSRYAEEKNWQGAADECRTVLETGLPVESRGVGREGEPVCLLISPIDADSETFRGVIAVMRRQAFSTEDVDFVRLLGIELGAATVVFQTPRDEDSGRLRVPGE